MIQIENLKIGYTKRERKGDFDGAKILPSHITTIYKISILLQITQVNKIIPDKNVSLVLSFPMP